MEYKTVVVKEKTEVVVLYDWKDVLVVCLAFTFLGSLISGLLSYQAGENAVCNKLGVEKIETIKNCNGWWPDKTVDYLPKK